MLSDASQKAQRALLFALSESRCAGCAFDERHRSHLEPFGLQAQHILPRAILPHFTQFLEQFRDAKHVIADEFEVQESELGPHIIHSVKNKVLVCGTHNRPFDNDLCAVTIDILSRDSIPDDLRIVLQDWWLNRITTQRRWRNQSDLHAKKWGLSRLSDVDLIDRWGIQSSIRHACSADQLRSSDWLKSVRTRYGIPEVVRDADPLDVFAELQTSLRDPASLEQLVHLRRAFASLALLWRSSTNPELPQLRELIHGHVLWTAHCSLGPQLPKFLMRSSGRIMNRLLRWLNHTVDEVLEFSFLENAIIVAMTAKRMFSDGRNDALHPDEMPSFQAELRTYQELTKILERSVMCFGGHLRHMQKSLADAVEPDTALLLAERAITQNLWRLFDLERDLHNERTPQALDSFRAAVTALAEMNTCSEFGVSDLRKHIVTRAREHLRLTPCGQEDCWADSVIMEWIRQGEASL